MNYTRSLGSSQVLRGRGGWRGGWECRAWVETEMILEEEQASDLKTATAAGRQLLPQPPAFLISVPHRNNFLSH